MLAQIERAECWFVDRGRGIQAVIGLVFCQRFASERAEKAIDFALVVAFLLQDALHVRNHAVRRQRLGADINRRIIGVILVGRVVTPSRKPIAIVEVVRAAGNDFDAGVMGVIPALVMPRWVVGAKHFILRALPLLGSADPVALVEGDGRNFLWIRLGLEIGVLCPDLLHNLRIGLLGPVLRSFGWPIAGAGCIATQRGGAPFQLA